MEFDLVVDSSALVAILREEAGCEDLQERLSRSTPCIASPTVLETLLVLTSVGQVPRRLQLEDYLRAMNVSITDFLADDYQAAYSAFLRFGKGRHPAGLNFGDCLVYALASRYDCPVLFTGADFAQTDLKAATY